MVFWKKSGDEQDREREDMKNLAKDDPDSLGNIMVRMGVITPEVLQEALDNQVADSPRLGDILLEMDAINPETLRMAVLSQKIARGEATSKEASEYHFWRKRLTLQTLTDGLDDIAELSTKVAAKLKMKK